MENALKGSLAFKGERGYSAYEIAVQEGFQGSKEVWLEQIGYEDINAKLPANVKNFGAVGDGVTDDTEAIQQALDNGGDIHFPNGTYLFTEVTVGSNTSIIGYQNSILKGKKINITGENNRISNIKYDGNLDSDGIDVTGNYNTIDNCEIYNIKNNDGNLGRGIDIRGCQYVTIKDCYFHDLISGNEEAPEGLEEGAIRAIRTHESDFVNIYNNKFEGMSGLKDGDYIHVQSGSLGEADSNFPYNGTNRANLNEIKIYDNTFIQNTCKSCVKVQCSDVSIYNNKFVLDNKTSSHYAVIRVQMGDRNNIYDNEFKVKSGTANYNHIILMEYTANDNIKNNIFDVDITESVDANSTQNIIQLQKVKNIRITNNNFNLKDLRYILYFDSVNEVVVKENSFKGVFTNATPTLLRVLDQNEHISNRIHFLNNFYEEVVGETLTTKQSFVQINPVNGIHINNNKFILNRNYIYFYFDNSTNVVFNKNEISTSSAETLHYPIAFGGTCLNIDVKNNYSNSATAFVKLNATVSNFHFTANGEFEDKECVSLISDQDLGELYYYNSDYTSMNYDFGYGARAVNYQNGHTFYRRDLMKLLTYYDSSWYVDGAEYVEE